MFNTVHRLENTDGSSQYLEKNNNIYNKLYIVHRNKTKPSLCLNCILLTGLCVPPPVRRRRMIQGKDRGTMSNFELYVSTVGSTWNETLSWKKHLLDILLTPWQMDLTLYV